MIFYYGPQDKEATWLHYMLGILPPESRYSKASSLWFRVEKGADIIGRSPFPGYLLEFVNHEHKMPDDIIDRALSLGFVHIRVDDSAARALFQSRFQPKVPE